MTKISLPLAVSLAIVAGVAGMGAGYSLTSEYRTSMLDKTTMGLGAADRRLDLRYANAMISHHRAAMLLAEQATSRATRPETKDLAATILKNEPGAIDELYAFRKQWYGDESKVKDPTVAFLGNSDDKFDLRFLNALVAHHEAGLEMTAEAKQKSSRTEVVANADAVDTFLTTTLKVFKDWRKQWYNI